MTTLFTFSQAILEIYNIGECTELYNQSWNLEINGSFIWFTFGIYQNKELVNKNLLRNQFLRMVFHIFSYIVNVKLTVKTKC